MRTSYQEERLDDKDAERRSRTHDGKGVGEAGAHRRLLVLGENDLRVVRPLLQRPSLLSCVRDLRSASLSSRRSS